MFPRWTMIPTWRVHGPRRRRMAFKEVNHPSSTIWLSNIVVENGAWFMVHVSMIYDIYLVGGLEHFLCSHRLGMSSSQSTFISFRGVETTNQFMIIYLWNPMKKKSGFHGSKPPPVPCQFDPAPHPSRENPWKPGGFTIVSAEIHVSIDWFKGKN